MTGKQTHQEIGLQAAEWTEKVDAGLLTPAEQAAFNAWLAADMRHLGAYARAEAILSQLERVGAAGAESLRQSMPRRRQITRRGVVLTGSVAAGIGVTIGGADFVWRYLTRTSYRTLIGETQVVPLVDGSVITLNTNSKVAVNYTKLCRAVRLVQGEALFDVAKNRGCPFIVFAGNTQVRAVGTSFTVKLLPDLPMQVLVQEGTVEVKREDVPQARPVRVSLNSKVLAPTDAPIETHTVEPAQIDRDLAWRAGRIAFDNEALNDAADEFARYSSIRIEIDPAVAGQTVTGLFVSNDPVGFARAAAASLGLHVEIGEMGVRIIR